MNVVEDSIICMVKYRLSESENAYVNEYVIMPEYA